MGYSITGRNAAVDGVTAEGTWISLHEQDPANTGKDEIAGGTYTREQTTWPAADSGSAQGSQVTIDVPDSTTITHWGLWTNDVSGTFICGGSLSASEVYTNSGTYNFTPTITANAAV